MRTQKAHAAADSIDDYVARLDRALSGPGRLRRDLVSEARDGLLDAAEAYERDGLDPGEARVRAVADFGTLEEVLPAYHEELAAGQGRRTAALLFISVPVTALMWSLLWKVFPDPGGVTVAPTWFMVVAKIVDLMQLAMGVLGGLALLALRRRRPWRVTRFLGVAVWVQFPIMTILCASLTVAYADKTAFADYPPGMVLNAISLVFWTWQLWSAARALSVTGSGRFRSLA